MQSWINFWNIIYWLVFSFFMLNSMNFTKLLFISEIAWLILYNYTVLVGTINDDLTTLSLSFFILGFAGLEFCVGMLLVIIFKRILRLDYFTDTSIIQKKFFEISKKKLSKVHNINVNEV